MSDRIALANAIEGAGIERAKAADADPGPLVPDSTTEGMSDLPEVGSLEYIIESQISALIDLINAEDVDAPVYAQLSASVIIEAITEQRPALLQDPVKVALLLSRCSLEAAHRDFREDLLENFEDAVKRTMRAIVAHLAMAERHVS